MKRFMKCIEKNRVAFDTVRACFERGMSEKDIKARITSAWGVPADRQIGDIAADGRIDGEATDYVLQDGDCLIVDLQPDETGCFCDTTRTFFVGEPTDKQKHAYEAVLFALSEMEKCLATHPKACEVHAAMQTALAKYGYACPHHAGHRVGAEKMMQPQLLPEKDTFLTVGDIVALEPGVYADGVAIRVENNYILTEDGIENLFIYPTEIKKFTI